MAPRGPLFVARFSVRRTEDGGPRNGFFVFPESGLRPVPARFDESHNMATIGIYYDPNAQVPNGESFEADCRVLDESFWAPRVQVGLQFRIWDGRDIIDAKIVQLFPENWTTPLS